MGEGPLRDAIGVRAAELGVADAVTLAGEVPGETAGRWLRASDVCVLASLREGFGLAVAEGLACGRPVAVSRAAGAAPLVREGVTGTLLDPLDVSSIASAIVRSAALAPAEQAVESVAAFSLERETERLAAVLEAAIERRR